jgi:hypothetical protein
MIAGPAYVSVGRASPGRTFCENTSLGGAGRQGIDPPAQSWRARRSRDHHDCPLPVWRIVRRKGVGLESGGGRDRQERGRPDAEKLQRWIGIRRRGPMLGFLWTMRLRPINHTNTRPTFPRRSRRQHLSASLNACLPSLCPIAWTPPSKRRLKTPFAQFPAQSLLRLRTLLHLMSHSIPAPPFHCGLRPTTARRNLDHRLPPAFEMGPSLPRSIPLAGRWSGTTRCRLSLETIWMTCSHGYSTPTRRSTSSPCLQ